MRNYFEMTNEGPFPAENAVTYGMNKGMNKTVNTEAESLTEAFHVLFDIKDKTEDDSVRYSAYQAVNAIKQTMYKLGMTVPERYDGQGRP